MHLLPAHPFNTPELEQPEEQADDAVSPSAISHPVLIATKRTYHTGQRASRLPAGRFQGGALQSDSRDHPSVRGRVTKRFGLFLPKIYVVLFYSVRDERMWLGAVPCTTVETVTKREKRIAAARQTCVSKTKQERKSAARCVESRNNEGNVKLGSS